MAKAGTVAVRELSRELRAHQEEILEEFRKRTPGYGDQHVIGEAGSPHTHSGDYEYTQVLVNSWKFADYTGTNTVGAVINTAPYAALVEYGYMSASGEHVHGGGHRMIESTLKGGEVRRMYAQMAGKALIVSLAASDYETMGKIAASQIRPSAVPRKKEGFGVYFYRGKTYVRGAGVDTAALRKAAAKLGDMICVMLNQGARR